MTRTAIFLVFTWLVNVPAHAGADDDLEALIQEHWAWVLDQSPETRTYLGERSGADQWDDMSLDALDARHTKRGEFRKRLGGIDVGALSGANALNHQMLTRQLNQRRRYYELGLHLMNISMMDGPQQLYTMADSARFENAQDYRNWLARLEAVPQVLEQHRELLAMGIARERMQAHVVMERVPGQLEKILTDDPTLSPFYAPFLSMPASLDAEVARVLREEASEVIDEKVTPAYRQFNRFVAGRYLGAARREPGIGSLPGGKDIYEFLAEDFTTTSMSPRDIHDLGKQEVARILSEMEKVLVEVGFEGDLQAFNEFLRTDPQFYYSSPEALLEAYQALSKRIDPGLVKLFGVLPRAPYGVKAIPDELAPDSTTAYYMQPAANGTRPGYYYVNLYRPEVRPKYEMEVLSVHEAVPGHHLQIALAQELPGLPMFRKISSITAFVEGWALYSERLGYQMGLYEDPYSRYGQLTYDMWRAVRLVVDTGIHYFGWSRERAIDYFKAHAGKTEADIINEVDRYIGWPGQALAYKIGQMKILELRAAAESRLGEDFDIRAFHDEALGAGAIPLDALEVRMLAWIERQ